MKTLLMKGDQGAEVGALARALARALGDDAAEFPTLPKADSIDAAFDAAIRRWQAGVGLIADGIVGPQCQVLLGLAPPQGGRFDAPPLTTVAVVSRLFPATKPANIARYLPYVTAALGATGLTDRPMVLAALGTVRAETEGFVPIAEMQSKFNTDPGRPPFNRYDHRRDIGNDGDGQGLRYRGRGFVQLTGRANYVEYGEKLQIPLGDQPDLANAPEVAALLLATFLADKATRARECLARQDYAGARRLVNGGSHGLDRFRSVFELAGAVAPPARRSRGAAVAAVPATRFRASLTSAKTKKDAADLRDRLFLPAAISLPDVHPSPEQIGTHLGRYTRAGLILDQGVEGACTGFGLACVVNYLRWRKADTPDRGFESVSPRMLYTLARRHDEYEGENYEGSSCRGAIKAWFHNGVCLESDWPYEPEQANPPRYGYARRATQTTLGVYYRVDAASITDMQAAIHQHGAVFVSAYTHDGWFDVPKRKAPKVHADLPAIAFDSRPSQGGGHAFAIVGFDDRGFIVQNSWGKAWGSGGFAVLTYLDWVTNAMDALVVALGVPHVVEGRVATRSRTPPSAAKGAAPASWWGSEQAYLHSVVLGNDGRVSRYLTEDEKPRKLQHQAYTLPDQWFRAQPAGRRQRLVVYCHGGLNSEADAIKRARAMGRFFVANGCYPLFVVWKTGLLETLGNVLSEAVRGGPAKSMWTDASDVLVEKTIGRPLARPMWSEMKENAGLAFAPRRGGELLLEAVAALAETWGDGFELHLVGHSAGAIVLGHLLTALRQRERLLQKVASVHLYAPACTVAFANDHYARLGPVMERLYLELLSDKVERDDSVAAVYRKSLLYLVSNALEADPRTPILGLDAVSDPAYAGWDGTSDTGEVLAAWRRAADDAQLKRRTTRTAADRITVALDAAGEKVLQRAAHGGFDNDIDVVTRTLQRITGEALQVPVDDLRGY